MNRYRWCALMWAGFFLSFALVQLAQTYREVSGIAQAVSVFFFFSGILLSLYCAFGQAPKSRAQGPYVEIIRDYDSRYGAPHIPARDNLNRYQMLDVAMEVAQLYKGENGYFARWPKGETTPISYREGEYWEQMTGTPAWVVPPALPKGESITVAQYRVLAE